MCNYFKIICVFLICLNGQLFGQFDYSGWYTFTAKHNGKVLDVGCDDVYKPNNPNSQRDNVCAYTWHGGDNQRWKIELLEDGYYKITAKHNGKVLDVGCDDVYKPNNPNSQRDNVCAYTWHGGDNQRWKIELLGNGFFKITAKHNGKVLDVGCDDVYKPNNPNSQRNNVCVYTWHGGDNQRWKMLRLP